MVCLAPKLPHRMLLLGHPLVHYCFTPSLKIRWGLMMVMGSKTNKSSCKRHSSFSTPLFDIAKEYIGICSSYRSNFMITVPWKIWSGTPRISWAMSFLGWHSNQASLPVCWKWCQIHICPENVSVYSYWKAWSL